MVTYIAKAIEKIEAEQIYENDFNETPPPDIVAFNELRSCADLVRMYNSHQLDIKPDFQRDIVWTKADQTRFIDSLVKQLPIPSMCISFDYKTGVRLMIDGLQRINSIIYFLTDDTWRLSSLQDIDGRISGRTVSYIKEKHNGIYSRLENLTIPVTVLRCDYSKHDHMNYLFTIFHRLNTGGNKLNNQEIRNCIYQGKLNDLLKLLVKYQNFRDLFGLDPEKSYRFWYEELILRIFAFSDNYNIYNGKLAIFLNNYMSTNRILSTDMCKQKENVFKRTTDLIYNNILEGSTLSNTSKAVTEAIFIGVIYNIDVLETEIPNKLKKRYANLLSDDNFSIDNLKEGLSQKDKVVKRINAAINIFS